MSEQGSGAAEAVYEAIRWALSIEFGHRIPKEQDERLIQYARDALRKFGGTAVREPVFKVGDRVALCASSPKDKYHDASDWLPGVVGEVNQALHGPWRVRVGGGWFWEHDLEFDVPGTQPCAFVGEIVHDESGVPLGVLLWQQGRWVLRRAGYIEVQEPLYERLRREIGGSMVPDSAFVSVSDAARAAERVFDQMEGEVDREPKDSWSVHYYGSFSRDRLHDAVKAAEGSGDRLRVRAGGRAFQLYAESLGFGPGSPCPPLARLRGWVVTEDTSLDPYLFVIEREEES